MSTLIPQPFWFRVAHSCRRVEAMPRVKGRLLDLSDAHDLVDLGRLDGKPGWAKVRAAWNPKGLGFSFEVFDKVGEISPDPSRPSVSDGVQIWIDTRDTRTVHRATRYCSRFQANLARGAGRSLDVLITQKPIARALANPPMTKALEVAARAERTVSGWRLELFFPGDTLAGFDPEANRRLGLSYHLTDPNRGELCSGMGREFPVGEDPSLWATLILEDET